MRRFFCALLLSALILTGCGKTGGEPGLLEQASGLSPDVVVLTVDGREVPAWQVLYWLGRSCDTLSAQCAGETPDWASPREGGQTLGGYAKAQALRTTVLYAEIAVWAERYGCALTDADQALIQSEWPAEGGEKQALSEEMGLRTEDARALCAVYCLYDHLLELFRTQGSALYPPGTTAADYLTENGGRTVAVLEIPADPSSPELRTQGRAQAEKAREALAAAPDAPGQFAALAEPYGTVSQVTFLPGDGALDEALEQAAGTLAEGALSAVLETPAGFALLLRRPLSETADALYFDHLLQAAADGAKVEFTRAYVRIDPADFYAKLTAARAQTGEASEDSSNEAASASDGAASDDASGSADVSDSAAS